MPRNLIRPALFDAEPMLGEVSHTIATRTWLPMQASRAQALDTARWQTRAARGLSWHRSGIDRRGMH